MPTLSKPAAIEKLTDAVKGMRPDDLLDFHNELFPMEPQPKLDPKDGVAAVRKKITDYLGQGLEVEELLDLWNVAFPEACNVEYDDETDMIHYLEEPDSIHQVD
jgi:hypothetical protein